MADARTRTTTTALGSLEDRLRGLFVALVLLLNLAPALGTSTAPVALGGDDGCAFVDAPVSDCCCEPAPAAASCCPPVDTCGCTTRPTRPAEEGLVPDAVLPPAADRGFELHAALERAAVTPAALAPTTSDAGALVRADHDPPGVPRLAPPGDTAGRLGLLRGTGARLAFLATLLS